MTKTDELYMTTAVAASVRAGQAILQIYHSDFAVERKKDNTPLTLADKRSHEIIVAYLEGFDIPILSEEGSQASYEQRGLWQTLWIVDPLDGTKEFIKRNGEFTVNIALVQKGMPVFGVVFVPDKNTLYFAEKGSGTYRLQDAQLLRQLGAVAEGTACGLNLACLIEHAVRMPVQGRQDRPYTIVGSRSHLSEAVEAFVEEKRKRFSNVAFVSAGSSVKFCLVAEGGADIYPRLGPTMEWDTAAGQAVAEGAGATVVEYDTGKPLTYNKENLLNPWFVVSRTG